MTVSVMQNLFHVIIVMCINNQRKNPYLSRLPWIFPGASFKVNGPPGNIQGNLRALKILIDSLYFDHIRL